MINKNLQDVIDKALDNISNAVSKLSNKELMREIPLLYDPYIKELKNFKDVHLGLYALDSNPENMLSNFWESNPEMKPNSTLEQSKQNAAFKEFVKERSFRIGLGYNVSSEDHYSIKIAENGFDVSDTPTKDREEVIGNSPTLGGARKLAETLN